MNPLRGQHQILDYIRTVQDPTRAILQTLVPFLDYEHVKPLVSSNVTPEIWGGAKPCARSYVEAKLIEALETGWTKAQHHNAVGANRNTIIVRTYLWLLDDQAALQFVDDERNYSYYGCPILLYLAKKYGVAGAIPRYDGLLRMATGKPCFERCEQCTTETVAGRL